MPIPTILPTENRDEYVSRCVPVLVEKDNINPKKAAAICYTTWSNGQFNKAIFSYIYVCNPLGL